MTAVAERRQLLLDGRAGWHAGTLRRLVADGESLRLRFPLDAGRPLVDARGTFGGLTLPTGAALDARGRLYRVASEGTSVERFDRCCGDIFEQLACIGGSGSAARELSDAHGIAVSARGDLHVADSGNRRVQVFALKGLALRALWGPERVPAGAWLPWDIEISPRGRVYVSDPENGVIHVFDHAGCRVAGYDRGAGGAPLVRPTHLALDLEGRLYVVQEGSDYVTVLDEDGAFVERARRTYELEDRFRRPELTVDAQGGVQGSETALAAYEADGVLYSRALDSRLFRCTWHRLVVRASIPTGTHVRVDTFTAETDKTPQQIRDLSEARWARGQVDALVGDGEWDCLIHSPPGRYLWLRLTLVGGGAETPAVRTIRVHFPRRSSIDFLPAPYREDPAGADFLGRFLSIFDTLRGGIGNQVAGIAAYFDPCATPADPAAPGRPDFLSWLASWLGLSLDRSWPVAKRRTLVREAHRLYKLRGTPEGLRLHVRLYAGVEPRILEHFKLRRWLFADASRLGDQSVLWGTAIADRLQLDENSEIGSFQLLDSGDPLRDPMHRFAHRFTVFVPAVREVSEVERITLERIVELAKPAHTEAEVRFGEPGLRIGTHAFVGVDTVLGLHPAGVRAGSALLGRGSVLGPSPDEAEPPTLRVGMRSRIGSSTVID